MGKINCWEFKKCGLQPGGEKIGALGICVAATDKASNGKNGGWNAGRYCWEITGTLCGNKVQGTFTQKIADCAKCDFFKKIRGEEGDNLEL